MAIGIRGASKVWPLQIRCCDLYKEDDGVDSRSPAGQLI